MVIMKKIVLMLMALLLAPLAIFAQSAQEKQLRDQTYEAYQPTAKQQKQIDKLISKMTIEEKAKQLASYYPNFNHRLDIPHIQAGECLHGAANENCTSFPQAIALGSTWDPELIERVSSVIAREVRACGIHHCYSPNLGLARDPRWGRFEECYGEDPELVSQIAKAFVIGLQGQGDQMYSRDKIIATGKHFVADGRPQSGANGASEELSERIMHELYLKPYRVAVQEAHLGAIMPAHHAINGEPCHSNSWLLSDVLKGEYGFDGIIVCDNGDIKGVKDMFRRTETYAEAAKLAIEAGLNSELVWMGEWGERRMFGPTLIEAVEDGLISMETLDKAVAKVLQYKMMLNIFGEKTFDESKNEALVQGGKIVDYASTAIGFSAALPREDCQEVLFDPSSNDVALEAANKAMILLKNANNLLPLDLNKSQSIALIGPNANDETLLGTYSTRFPRYFVTVKEGLESITEGRDITINYQEGVKICSDDRSGIAAAVEAAKNSDVAVVVLGDNKETIKENQDRDEIILPGLQMELLEAVVATGKPVVLVLIHGRTPAMAWIDENVDAILDGWFLGQESGNAVAQTLFGVNNPAGKTTVTYPRSVGMLPQCYNDIPPGRKHSIYQGVTTPVYPFGYGLSYTEFEYSAPVLSSSEMSSPDEPVYVTVTVKNIGGRAGDEVVQMYVKDNVSSLVRPLKELKDFKRISLGAGEAQEVRFEVGRNDLEFWKNGEWIVEPGTFEVMVGASSQSTQSVTLTIK